MSGTMRKGTRSDFIKNAYMTGVMDEWARRWRPNGGQEGERSGCFQLRLESDSSSEVISLIHSGRCANILPKISWQHTQAALMLEVFTLCGPVSPTNTRTNTNAHTQGFTRNRCHGSHLWEQFGSLGQISGPWLRAVKGY